MKIENTMSGVADSCIKKQHCDKILLMFVFVCQEWKCSCQKDECKHICDGLLERDLSGAPGDFCLIISHCQLSVSSMLPHSSTMGRTLSPAISFHSLQSGSDETI